MTENWTQPSPLRKCNISLFNQEAFSLVRAGGTDVIADTFKMSKRISQLQLYMGSCNFVFLEMQVMLHLTIVTQRKQNDVINIGMRNHSSMSDTLVECN